jgi:hypothetical protein
LLVVVFSVIDFLYIFLFETIIIKIIGFLRHKIV